MKFIISLTLRGFVEHSNAIAEMLNGNCKFTGDRGGLYRGRTGTKNSKSFVFNQTVSEDKDGINASILAIIDEWGGPEKIDKVRSDFGIEDIYMGIRPTQRDGETVIAIGVEAIAYLARAKCRLVISH